MTSLIKKIGLTLLAVVVLRFAAAWITASSPYFDLVINDELDPSQMFYTESKEALKAEKEVHRSISEIHFQKTK